MNALNDLYKIIVDSENTYSHSISIYEEETISCKQLTVWSWLVASGSG